MDEAAAREVAIHSLRLLYYRNRESSNKVRVLSIGISCGKKCPSNSLSSLLQYQLTVVTKDGSVLEPIKEFEGVWDTALMIRGYE